MHSWLILQVTLSLGLEGTLHLLSIHFYVFNWRIALVTGRHLCRIKIDSIWRVNVIVFHWQEADISFGRIVDLCCYYLCWSLHSQNVMGLLLLNHFRQVEWFLHLILVIVATVDNAVKARDIVIAVIKNTQVKMVLHHPVGSKKWLVRE